jgi:hypothetical protein
MAGPLSFAQEEALRSLHRGWQYGIDARTQRGLAIRGLVTVRDFTPGTLTFHDMPFLTDEGRRIAAKLVAAQELAAGVRQLRNGFRVIQGGLA